MCWATPGASTTWSAVPGTRCENLSAKKLFHINEGTSFSVRMGYFNAFNRAQEPYPNTTANSPTFGEVTTKFAGGNRERQIQASFNF